MPDHCSLSCCDNSLTNFCIPDVERGGPNAIVLENQTILREEYEGFGEVRQARPAARFESTPSKISRPAPKLGEHGKEILTSLGISKEEQEKLIKENKIYVSES